MARKGKRISESTLQGTGASSQGAGSAISTGFPLDNKALKDKYDQMHKQGVDAWFSDGQEERETILKMGEPWEGKVVAEFGCGEGDLCNMIATVGAWDIVGLDYSGEAISKAKSKYPNLTFLHNKYKDFATPVHIIVMQGVLEHLDDPFGELQWMIERFKPKTVITSSPCFLNPRGIVWMTLDMLGAVMSKTDLHFLHPWDFEAFCEKHGYKLEYCDCDISWGNHDAMIQDLKQRIPLALRDSGLPEKSPYRLLRFLDNHFCEGLGATMVYRIDIPC